VRACFFDPDSHDVYLAFAAHWGFTPLPTQPRRPDLSRHPKPAIDRHLKTGHHA